VIGVQGLDGQRQVAGCFEELRHGHVELVQTRKSGGQALEEDRRLLAAYVNRDIRIRRVERGDVAGRAVGHGGSHRAQTGEVNQHPLNPDGGFGGVHRAVIGVQGGAAAAARRIGASLANLSLRPVLGLLHGDLVDGRQGLGSAGTLDGFHRDVPHLLLGRRQLFLNRRVECQIGLQVVQVVGLRISGRPRPLAASSYNRAVSTSVALMAMGFGAGFIVGLTSIGGATLMTPFLCPSLIAFNRSLLVLGSRQNVTG